MSDNAATKNPRQFKFTVMPEPMGFNIVWHMKDCNFHDGAKLITGDVHVIEYSAYEAVAKDEEKWRLTSASLEYDLSSKGIYILKLEKAIRNYVKQCEENGMSGAEVMDAWDELVILSR